MSDAITTPSPSPPTTSLGSVTANAPAQQALATLRQTETAVADAITTVATGSLAPGLGGNVDISA